VHDVIVTAELSAALVEVLPRRGGAEEHLGRDAVMYGSAPRLLDIEMVIGERGVLVVIRQMLRQRVARDRFLGRIREIDIPGHILDVPAVVHPREEELLGIAEDDGTDP